MLKSRLFLIINETYFAIFCINGQTIEGEHLVSDFDIALSILANYKDLPVSVLFNLGNTKINVQELPSFKPLDKFLYLRNLKKSKLEDMYAYGCMYDRHNIIETSIPTFDNGLLNKIMNPLMGIFSIPTFTENPNCCLVVTKHDQYLRHSCFINGRIEFTRFLKIGISSTDETLLFIKNKYGFDAHLIDISSNKGNIENPSDYYLVKEINKGNCLALESQYLQKPANEPVLSNMIKHVSLGLYSMLFLFLGISASSYYQGYKTINESEKKLADMSTKFKMEAKDIKSIEAKVQDAKLKNIIGDIPEPIGELQLFCKGLPKIHQLNWQNDKTLVHVKTREIESLNRHCEKIKQLGYHSEVMENESNQGEISKKGQLLAANSKEINSVIKIEKIKS